MLPLRNGVTVELLIALGDLEDPLVMPAIPTTPLVKFCINLPFAVFLHCADTNLWTIIPPVAPVYAVLPISCPSDVCDLFPFNALHPLLFSNGNWVLSPYRI